MAEPWKRNWGASQPTAPKPWERSWGALPQQQPVAPLPQQAAEPTVPIAGLEDPIALPEAEIYRLAGVEQPQPAAPERGVLDTITGLASQFGIGSREGISAVAGLPVDIVNNIPRVANILPGEQGFTRFTNTPVGGSDFFNDLLAVPERIEQSVRGLPQEDRASEGFWERMLRRTGQEVGAATVPVAGSLGAAGRMTVQQARELPAVARMMVEPAVVSPGRFVTQEAGSAAAAGAGAGGAVELARMAGAEEGGTAENLADLAGALGGAGALGALRAVSDPLVTTAAAITDNPNMVDPIMRDMVADAIGQQSGAPMVDRVPDTAAIAELAARGSQQPLGVPGVQPSLGDVTGDAGIRALEYGRSGGPNAGRYIQRREQNAQAVDQAMSQLEPQGNPGALRAEAETRRAADLQEAAEATSRARDTFDIATRDLQSVLTADVRGAQVRAALQDASDKAKAIMKEAWAPLDRGDEVADIGPLTERFRGVDEGLTVARTRRFRPSEADIPAQLQDMGRTELREVTGLRSALTSARREAANAGDSDAAHVISQYIDQLDGYMDDVVPEGLRADYDAAKAATVDYKDRFTRPQSAIAQTLDTREGQYKEPNSGVTGRFVQADEGNVANFQTLMQEAGADERVRAAVRDQMLSDIGSRKLLEKPDRLEEYLGRYKTVLDEFPDLRAELSDAANVRRELAAVEGREKDLQNLIGSQGRGVVAEYLKFGGDQAGRAMSAVMGQKDPGAAMDTLLNYVDNTPEAVAGARQAFWDLMEGRTRSGTGKTWSADKLEKFLGRPQTAAALGRLYQDSPEHIENLHKIMQTMRAVDTRTTGKAAAQSGTPQGMLSNAPSFESTMSRAYSVNRGVIGVPFAVTNLLGIWARKAVKSQQKAAFDMILDKALLEPDFAAVLLRENNPASRAALRRVTRGWQPNQVATLIDILEVDDDSADEDANIKQRVMEGAQ